MTRSELIHGLKFCSRADREKLNDRLQSCSVKIYRRDSAPVCGDALRTVQQVITLLTQDETVEAIKYRFNGEWRVLEAIAECQQ